MSELENTQPQDIEQIAEEAEDNAMPVPHAPAEEPAQGDQIELDAQVADGAGHAEGVEGIHGAETEACTELAEGPSPSPDAEQEQNGIMRTVHALFAEGVESMKEVSAARRAHAAARDELERLDERIASQEHELAHRRDIEARYNEIIASETAGKNAAEQERAAAQQLREKFAAKLVELKQQLEDMREEDATTERRLKTALEAAEDKEHSARESGRRLQRRMDDAQANLDRTIKEREEGIAAAQQAVQSAEAHLATLNAEYAEIQKNPSANPAGYSVRKRELENEISDATEAVRNAKGDVPRIERETQAAIEDARAALAEAERPITQAREAFNAVAAAADKARDAYGEAKDTAERRQKDLRATISDGEKAIKAQDRAAQEAQAKADAAQAAIDEANEIHEHPEVAVALDSAIESDRTEREGRAAEVERLAAVEDTVRDRTRTARVRLALAICGIALIVVLMLVWTYFAK
ncbi:MAG: hypothetical protein Q4B77_04245 [Coriobacteriaceae bacterium]|nr:hypothetical protein [Coriobacteriaceae bacterium]